MELIDSELDTGVSVVIGAFLIITISILALSIYQVQVVPKQEEAREIRHHRTTINKMQDINAKILQSANGRPTSVNIKLGLRYGSPTSVFVNSPPSSGTIYTQELNENLIINNAQGLDKASVFWDTDDRTEVGDGTDVTYKTSMLKYEPQYYHFQTAPNIVISNGLTYKEYQNNKIAITQQSIVNGKNINLVLMEGDISSSRVNEVTVQIRPISASQNSISITNKQSPSQPISIEIPTKLSVQKWREILSAERCDDLNDEDKDSCDPSIQNNTYITEVDPASGNRIEIFFEEGTTYDLKMSKLFLTTQESTVSIPDTNALYASWVGSDEITIREGSTVNVPATALDKYNNPVDGARVVAEALEQQGGSPTDWPDDCFGGYTSGVNYRDGNYKECDDGQSNSRDFFQRGIDVSDNDGNVDLIYEAPKVSGDVSIRFRVCLGRYIEEDSDEITWSPDDGGGDNFNDPDGGSYMQCKEVDGNRNEG